jgi:hypothetical protein
MKKVIRLTEDDLNKIVKRVINENDRVYGGSNIKKLYNNLKDDEYVHLDDTSGELSGDVVSKIEYVKRMLKSAIREENWSKVENTILFIDAMMKP